MLVATSNALTNLLAQELIVSMYPMMVQRGNDKMYIQSQTEFIWPAIAGLGHLECDGSSSCSGVNSPPTDPNTPLNLTLNDSFIISTGDIHCPSNASCSISCIAENACHAVCKIQNSIKH